MAGDSQANEPVKAWLTRLLQVSSKALPDRPLLPLPLKAYAIRRCRRPGISSVTVSMQGWRSSMEDDAAGCMSLTKHPHMVYAGVFDGHAGPKASRWFAKRLHNYLDGMKHFTTQEFIETCISADSDFLRANTAHDDGTTAVFLLLEPQPGNQTDAKKYQLTVGNIGDSRCLLIANHSTVQQLTEDHLPTLENEHRRIIKAGGFVSSGRVDGALAVSRAFGDFVFKDNMSLPLASQRVVSTPDVVRVENIGGSDIVLLCCDGIFECLSTQQVAAFLLERSTLQKDPAHMLCELMELSLSLGSQDNMTATLIQFESNEDPIISNASTDEKGQSTITLQGGEESREYEVSTNEEELRFGEMSHHTILKLSSKDRLDYLAAYVLFAQRYCNINCALDALLRFSKAYKLDMATIIESLLSTTPDKPKHVHPGTAK